MGEIKVKAILSWNILQILKTTKGRVLGFVNRFKETFSLFLKEENEIRNGIIENFFYSILMISSFASYVNGKMLIPSLLSTRTNIKDSSVSSS